MKKGMRLLVKILFQALILVCFQNVVLHANDTIAAKQLEDIIILNKRCWVEKEKIIIIPNKKEKQLSNSPASLIGTMHLAMLKEKDGEIVTLSGERANIFINGIKADKVDIATFWPKNVKRIEYYESTSNPKYSGARNVVDFIVQEYSVGGVARLDALQKFPAYGYYSASSKISYKKLSFGALVYGNYFHDHGTSAKGVETYNDIFYKNNYYDFLKHEIEEHEFQRDNVLNITLNTKYVSQNFWAIHSFSYLCNRNPGSGTTDSGKWSDDLFGNEDSRLSTKSKSISPQLSGNYFARLSNKWNFSWYWSYSYFSNNNSNRFTSDLSIDNYSNEDVHSVKIIALPSFKCTDKLRVQLRAQVDIDIYSIKYNRQASNEYNQNRLEFLSNLSFNWHLSDKLNISATPGIAISKLKDENVKHLYLRPTAGMSFNYKARPNIIMGGSLKFYMRSPKASEVSSAIVQSTNLIWITGNPHLKNLTSYDLYLSTHYLANDYLNISTGLGYVRTYNSLIYNYTAASDEKGGVIKHYTNAKPTSNYRANIDISGSFFNNHLSVSLVPQWRCTSTSGEYASTLNTLTFSSNIDLVFSNNSIRLMYEAPSKYLSLSGMEKSWEQDAWSISYTYGNGNVYFKLSIEDIFNKKHKSWVQYNSSNFSSTKHYLKTGRKLCVNFTYTFGFGKKIDRSINFDDPINIKTSIVN